MYIYKYMCIYIYICIMLIPIVNTQNEIYASFAGQAARSVFIPQTVCWKQTSAMSHRVRLDQKIGDQPAFRVLTSATHGCKPTTHIS